MLGCIIQARMGSSRLPGKVLMKTDEEKPLLFYVIKQLQSSKKIEKLIVATTDKPEDDVIEDYVKKLDIECFRGSEKDVLDRYFQCAKKFSLSTIIRITADCPLIDYSIVDNVIEKHFLEKSDYTTNTLIRTFPDGTDVEVFSYYVLEKAWKHASLPSEREHVTPFMRNEKMNLKLSNLESPVNLRDIRITVDQEEDYELIKKIILKIKKRPILLEDILELFENEPSLKEINQDIIPNEGMIKSLKEDEVFLKNKENQ